MCVIDPSGVKVRAATAALAWGFEAPAHLTTSSTKAAWSMRVSGWMADHGRSAALTTAPIRAIMSPIRPPISKGALETHSESLDTGHQAEPRVVAVGLVVFDFADAGSARSHRARTRLFELVEKRRPQDEPCSPPPRSLRRLRG